MINPDYCTADGLHVHQCNACGTTWSHPEKAGLDPDEPGYYAAFKKAHTCPDCGKEEFWKAELATVPVVKYPWRET